MRAMEVRPQAGESRRFIAVQPAIDRIRIAGTEQALFGHGMGTAAIGDLEQRRTPLAHLGMGIVIPAGY
jgi:hypothetical protein